MTAMADTICLWFKDAILISLNVILYFMFLYVRLCFTLCNLNVRRNVVFIYFDTAGIGISNMSSVLVVAVVV
jgi:hypothetical protein